MMRDGSSVAWERKRPKTDKDMVADRDTLECARTCQRAHRKGNSVAIGVPGRDSRRAAEIYRNVDSNVTRA